MEKSKNKFYIRTYGCQMNKYDSEIIKNLLLKLNFREVSTPEEADYVFLNTCAVREHAEKRVFGRLDSLKGLKRVKPDTVIGVLGCVAKYHPELIGHPVVDFLAPPDSYRNLIQWLKTKRKGTIPENENEEYSDIFISPNKISSYLSITRGCNYFCSYCVVPYTRGRIRSRPPEDILEEAQSLVDSGTKEIILLGQNINAYHYNGIDFPEILKRVSSIKGVKRLGFLTSHPGDLPKELFSVMAAFDNITNYLHLPLQSGSDKILTRMNRRYKLRDYIKIIEEARNLMPDLNLTTDIIVGFPGEEEEDFQKTLDAMKRIRFEQAYMFAYSKRKGTFAALFPNQVEKKVRKQRLQRLIYTQNEITREKARELIGKEMEVLILGEGKKGYKLGKNRNGRIIMTDGVAKIGTEYIIKINKVNGWVPFGGIKKEA
ncbi:MAG: tRNA (N6-isopentenyl adenosine(37)-C2)-methylthiotransferase MiaB [candidate division WOR-3 bacterium]|nr:tRNA (N6-isopentenyl adenosine(37)-C2)-methylthiotransferase MiaB [candidate division WOR-3 bacterium]